MSVTKIIYNADSEYPRTVILNHGGSETQVIYDSEPDPYENMTRWDKVKPSKNPYDPKATSWFTETINEIKSKF